MGLGRLGQLWSRAGGRRRFCQGKRLNSCAGKPRSFLGYDEDPFLYRMARSTIERGEVSRWARTTWRVSQRTGVNSSGPTSPNSEEQRNEEPHSSLRTREMGAQIKWTENRSSRSVTLY